METIKGLQAFINTLEKIPKELDNDVAAILEANAQDIERDAKLNAPVDTGFMQKTIATSVPISDKGMNRSRVVTSNAHYSGYVEFGTRFQQAQPFFFPAFFKGKQKLLRDLQDLLNSTFK